MGLCIEVVSLKKMLSEKKFSTPYTETVISSVLVFPSTFLAINRALAFKVWSCPDFHLIQPRFEEDYYFNI